MVVGGVVTTAVVVVVTGLVADVGGAPVAEVIGGALVVLVTKLVVGAGLEVVGEVPPQPVTMKAATNRTTMGINNFFNVSSFHFFVYQSRRKLHVELRVFPQDFKVIRMRMNIA